MISRILPLLILFFCVPAHAFKLEAISRMSSPAAEAVRKAASKVGAENPVLAFRVKYRFPENHRPGDLDDIYFYNDQVRATLADQFPRWGEAQGYSVGNLGPARWEFARRELAATPFLLAHEPLLDAMIEAVQRGGLTVVWAGRRDVPRGFYAYGIYDFENQEFCYVVNEDSR